MNYESAMGLTPVPFKARGPPLEVKVKSIPRLVYNPSLSSPSTPVVSCILATTLAAQTRASKIRRWVVSSSTVVPVISDAEVLYLSLQVLLEKTKILGPILAVDTKMRSEYFNIQPHCDESIAIFKGAPLERLNSLKQKGLIRDMEIIGVKRQGDFFYLATCDLDGMFVCGIGQSPTKKRCKHLAAQQVLDRFMLSQNPSRDLSSCRSEDAAEVLEVMSKHLQNVKMMITQPFGNGWKASLQCQFQGCQILGVSPSFCSTRRAAVAAAGESFLAHLREALHVPLDMPHAPAQWAQAIVNPNRHVVQLDALGSPSFDAEAVLAEVIQSGHDREALEHTLQEAITRQDERISRIQEIGNAQVDGVEASAYDPCIARRCFKVRTPEEEDWRREDVKGKLPAEELRDELSKALEYQQVVIVSGGTGSGKTTQLPQFLLDDFEEWKLEYPDGKEDIKEPLNLEVDMYVDVKYHNENDPRSEEAWYACQVLDVSDDRKTVTVRYKDNGDEEPYVDVDTRVRRYRHWMRAPPRIVVTQPRRIAAISLAERVAWERYGAVGEEVGYAIRGDAVYPEAETGTVEFCSAGTLLRRMVTNPMLRKFNVVVLDEVHERSLNTDFLLILLRELLPKRPELRLVLMSATLDVQTLADYFPRCTVLQVPSGTRFPVDEIHLEDSFFASFWQTRSLLQREALGREPEELLDKEPLNTADEEELNKSTLAEQIKQLAFYSDEAQKALTDNKDVDVVHVGDWDINEMVAFLAEHGVRPWKTKKRLQMVKSSLPWWGSSINDASYIGLAEWTILKVVPEMQIAAEGDSVGSILCFMPGWAEIKGLADRLEKCSDCENLWVLCLHSRVTKEEQQLVFEPAPEGKIKVILSTNIAETSVTITDVRVVVDTGLHRETSYNPRRRMSLLETMWICQSNAVQRKGRAGRVREGRVFRLYSKDQFEFMPWRPAPELQRRDLAQSCLQAIALTRDPREFLAHAPDPPLVSQIEAAMAELSFIDAILDGMPPRMLPVGYILTRMPLQPIVGRAMMLGTLFGVPQMTAALLVVAGVSSPFVFPPEMKKEGNAAKCSFCSWSDTVAAIRALDEFERIYIQKGDKVARQWADFNFLNFNKLLGFSRLKFQLLVDVERSGVLDVDASKGLNPAEWEGDAEYNAWQEAAAPHPDSAGAIFEADEDALMTMKHWLELLRRVNKEVEDERILIGILCSAFPANIAVFQKSSKSAYHKNAISGMCYLDKFSVNMTGKTHMNKVSRSLPNTSWWLYTDMMMYQSRLILKETTVVSGWHVALFGGLRKKDSPQLELDGWISLDRDKDSFVRKLREEIRQALTWSAIAASWDRVAQGALGRSKALLRILGNALLQKQPDSMDLQYLREWKLPVMEEGLATVEAEQNKTEVEQKLWNMRLYELKVLCQDLGLEDRGSKRNLVDRCTEALVDDLEDNEDDEGDEDDDEGDEDDEHASQDEGDWLDWEEWD